MWAVVRLRGKINVRGEIEETLELLRLHKVNHCVVIPENESYEGMLRKAQAYITWGPISKDVFKRMLLKRGRLQGNRRVSEDYIKQVYGDVDRFIDDFFKGKVKLEDIGIKPVFRLRPPRKGYRHVKRPWPRGAWGFRGEAINELLKRMI